MHKSDKVALALCGLGVASILGAVAWASSVEDGGSDSAGESPRYVSEGIAYAHNVHVPHAGWFHSPTRTFEPYPYNHYVVGHGYYHDGGWHPEAAAGAVVASAVPTASAVEKANGAISRASGSTGGSSKGSYSRSSGSGSLRGGFGSSGGHGGS